MHLESVHHALSLSRRACPASSVRPLFPLQPAHRPGCFPPRHLPARQAPAHPRATRKASCGDAHVRFGQCRSYGTAQPSSRWRGSCRMPQRMVPSLKKQQRPRSLHCLPETVADCKVSARNGMAGVKSSTAETGKRWTSASVTALSTRCVPCS